MAGPKKLSRSKSAGSRTANFLDLAYKDYLAARVLINIDLLIQGAILASTALEKHMKAILAFRGNECRGHLKPAHWRAAFNFDSRLTSIVNADFLTLLQKSYKLRYVDDLEDGFNLVIASREFLAELDHTCLMLQECFRLKQGDRQHVARYHLDKKNRDPRLVDNNYMFDHQDKQRFISAEPQLVHAIRKVGPDNILEMTYSTFAAPSDGRFLRPGVAPIPSSVESYQMAFKPIPPATEA